MNRRAAGSKAPVRVAVVGLGIGRMHLEHLAAISAAQVVGVCDADPARRKQVCRDFAVPFSSADLGSLLRELSPDALIVATPNHLHEEMVLAGLEAGCHVLCEKPLAHRLDSAERIERAARRRRKVTMLDLSFRFGAAARTAKAYAESGALGDVYHAHTLWARSRGIPFFGAWFHDRARSGGGPVVDLAVHRLDLALWLLGEPEVLSVSAAVHGALGRRLAERQRKAFDVEDLGVALLRLAGGKSLLLEASWAENSSRTERMCTRLLGVDGGLEHENVGDGYEFQVKLHRDRRGKLERVSEKRFARRATTPTAEFVAAIRGERSDHPNFETGRKLQRVLDAIYRSAAQGEEVRLGRPAGQKRRS